jgi:alkanesulfonate monooxygenase SsuD/methylene tetrahydromethanopterin reductase-like flavin-dependent oxidoreductase (luciferase family)
MARDAVELTRAARDAGLDLVMAGQHFLSAPYQMLQPLPLLARVAAEAGGMRIGTGVLLLTLLNPVQVAEDALTMDALTDGRFVLGLGLGYRAAEDRAFGVSERRVRVFERKLAVVRRLLAGEEVTAAAPGYALAGDALVQRPAGAAPPPLWLAANGDRAVGRAARLGDTWFLNPHARPQELARQLDLFHAERAAAGLPPPAELPLLREMYVGTSDEAAWTEARPYLEEKYRTYVGWGQGDVMPAGDALDSPWDQLAGRFIVGGPERCARELQAIVDLLGVDTLVLRMGWPGMPMPLVRAALERAAGEVLPRLRPREEAQPAPG